MRSVYDHNYTIAFEAVTMWRIISVKSIKNVTRLFSELLYQSVTSLTADSARVIRIVVGRSEVRYLADYTVRKSFIFR